MSKFEQWVKEQGFDLKSLSHDEIFHLSWIFSSKKTITREELKAHTEQQQKSRADREQLRQNLWWALRSRLLTPSEMEKVKEFGNSINTPAGIGYNMHEKEMELMTALFNQARLQLIAANKGDLFE